MTMSSDTTTPAAREPRAGGAKRLAAACAASAVTAALVLRGVGIAAAQWSVEGTDDAFLDGPIIPLAPKVAGQVVSVAVHQNQWVKKGDILAVIDPQDYEVQNDRRKAALASAQASKKLVEAGFGLLRARVDTARSAATEASADESASRATAERAAADFVRAQALRADRVASQQEFDSARAFADNAAAAHESAKDKVRTAQSRVDEAQAALNSAEGLFEQVVAQAKQAEADLKTAELNLGYTTITAPRAGRVTRKTVEPGAYVQVGQQLMSLVPDELWVTANFKETQLAKVRPGQPARIEIDAAPGRVFRGHVESMQAGSGARFSLLPPENAVGNYVKVVQRVPVKIVFDEPVQAEHVLGPGMSVQPEVEVSTARPPVWAGPVAALAAAILVGRLTWRAAGGRPAAAANP